MSVLSEGISIDEANLQDEPLPTEEIEIALDRIKSRVNDTEKQIAILEDTLVKAKKEQHLLEALASLRRGEQSSTEYTDLKRLSILSDEVPFSQSSNSVADAAVAALKDQERPMHIGEIMTVMKDQKVKLPGQGTQANLISCLTRDDRIMRTARGIYALSEWGLEEMHVPKRGSRKKRQKATKARTKRR